jgi:hypothetical protein
MDTGKVEGLGVCPTWLKCMFWSSQVPTLPLFNNVTLLKMALTFPDLVISKIGINVYLPIL